MESILTSIKKTLGIAEEYEHFDSDIIMHINSTFMILTQIGVGPEEGFSIKGKEEVWSDFITSEYSIELVKSYTFLRVKLLFDPPNNNALSESMNKMLNEFEWRIIVWIDSMKREREIQNG